MRPERAAGTFLSLTLVACGGARQMPRVAAGPAPVVVQTALVRLITSAFEADARLDSADSLYAPAATIVSSGRPVLSIPRFAGIEAGGQIEVSVNELQVRPGLAWALVDYSWSRIGIPQTREGRATVVLAPAPTRSGWWIIHVHSSVGAGS